MHALEHAEPARDLTRCLRLAGGALVLCGLELALRCPPGWRLSRLAVSLQIAIVKRARLFDREYYLAQASSIGAPLGLPLRHYVEHGDGLGLRPLPLFDPRFYGAQTRSAERRVNTLVHYLLWGRFSGRMPSRWFDPNHYARRYPDVTAAGADPLRHFLSYGWREGREPLAGLDMRGLVARVPNLKVAKSNPLAALVDHFESPEQLRRWWGRDEAAEPDLRLRELAQWTAANLRHRNGVGDPGVDVIVPVYRGIDETLRCLWSVLNAPVRTPFELVIVDDASPERALSQHLRDLAKLGLFTLLRNDANQGFVKAVNRGMALHPGRDVVILNSDTEVYRDWLDRLQKVAALDETIGSVTPLSNNATICSYPTFDTNNWLPLEVSHEDLDRLAGAENGLEHVDAPTGVGCCMWMRRRFIDSVGLFDEQSFGKGYGEENDWCQRVLAQGGRNVLAAGVYVYHAGSVSFRGEALRRIAEAQHTLVRRHVTYAGQVAAFVSEDPLWRARMRIDLARLSQRCGGANVLMVLHDRGGGTEKHVNERARSLAGRGVGAFELRPSARPGCVSLGHCELDGLPNLATLPLDPPDLLVQALRRLRITLIQVHHTIDFAPTLPEALLRVRELLGTRLDVHVHDYYAICPRINLVGVSGTYCGEPGPESCRRCLSDGRTKPDVRDIIAWRQRHGSLLKSANRVVVPHADVAHRLTRYFPDVAFEVEPHEAEIRVSAASDRPRRPSSAPRDVLVLGAINQAKGFDVIRSVAHVARDLQLPLRLSLLGYSSDDQVLTDAGVRLLGRYVDEEVAQRLRDVQPDAIWLPSVWPETYCYTLSVALASGLPVVVFDLGAQAERARLHPDRCQVVSLRLASDPAALAAALLGAAERSSPAGGDDQEINAKAALSQVQS